MKNDMASLTATAGLGNELLKHVLEMLLQLGEGMLETKVAANLHKGNHDLPPQPSDADRTAFLRHAVRQFAKAIVQSGAVSDIVRDFEVPRIAPTVAPQLVAGTTTKAGVHMVGTALVADLTSLVGQ